MKKGNQIINTNKLDISEKFTKSKELVEEQESRIKEALNLQENSRILLSNRINEKCNHLFR